MKLTDNKVQSIVVNSGLVISELNKLVLAASWILKIAVFTTPTKKTND